MFNECKQHVITFKKAIRTGSVLPISNYGGNYLFKKKIDTLKIIFRFLKPVFKVRMRVNCRIYKSLRHQVHGLKFDLTLQVTTFQTTDWKRFLLFIAPSELIPWETVQTSCESNVPHNDASGFKGYKPFLVVKTLWTLFIFYLFPNCLYVIWTPKVTIKENDCAFGFFRLQMDYRYFQLKDYNWILIL